MHHLIQTLFQYRLPVLLVLTLLVIIGCSASPSRGASKIVDFRQRDLAKISIEHTPSTAVVSQPIQNNYALLLLENAIRLQLADENRLQTDDAIHSLRLQLKILSYQDNVLLAQGKLYDDDEYLVYSQVKRRFAANEDWEEVMELVAEQMLDELMLKMRDLQQSAISEAPTKYFAYSSSYGNVRTYSPTIYSSNLSYSDPYYNNWGWWRRPRDDHHRHEHNAHRHDHQNKHHDEKHQDHHSENHPRRHWVDNGPITNPHLPGSGGKPRHDSKPNRPGLTPTPATLPTNSLEAVVNPITEPSTGPIVMPIDTTTATPTVGSSTELPVSSGIDNNAGNTATPSVDATGLPLTSVLPNNGSEATVNPITEPNTGPVVPSINSGPTTTNPTTDNSTGLPASPSVNTEIATPPVGTSVDTNLTPNSGSNTGAATLPSFDSGSSAPTLTDPSIGISPGPSAGTIAIDPSIAPSAGTRSDSNSGTSSDSGSSSTPNNSTNTEDSGIGSNGSIATTPSSGIESGSTGDSSSVPASSPSYSSGSSVGSASMDSNPSYSSGSSSSSSSSDSSPSYNSGASVGSSSMDSSPSFTSGSSSSSSAPEPAPAPPSPPPAPEPAPPPPPKSAPPASDNTATPPSP